MKCELVLTLEAILNKKPRDYTEEERKKYVQRVMDWSGKDVCDYGTLLDYIVYATKALDCIRGLIADE